MKGSKKPHQILRETCKQLRKSGPAHACECVRIGVRVRPATLLPQLSPIMFVLRGDAPPSNDNTALTSFGKLQLSKENKRFAEALKELSNI